MLILLVAGGEFRREFRREFRETVQNADNLLLNRQRRNGNAIVYKQAFWLSIIAISIGLILGYIVGILTSAADKISNPRSAFASLRQGGYTPLRR